MYHRPPLRLRNLVTIVAVVTIIPSFARADRVDGFTEPYRAIEVATAEVGIIRSIEVQESDFVEKGTEIALLDDEVQTALLSIAAKNLELRGRLESAEAELMLRRGRAEKLKSLNRSGHARREEVDRALADAAIAEAQVLSAHEELVMRQLEYKKTQIQVERRKILAPASGFVSVIYKEAGEFVAPTDPHILTIVQLDRLLATFSIPSDLIDQFGVDTDVSLTIHGEVVSGTVERISPITDAESDTVQVKIRVDNADGKFRSGQRCSLLLGE